MKENKEKDKSVKSAKPHFTREINYTEEPWRTDFILGQKRADSHGHLALSGATAWYFRDEEGKVIIEEGKVVKNTE